MNSSQFCQNDCQDYHGVVYEADWDEVFGENHEFLVMTLKMQE